MKVFARRVLVLSPYPDAICAAIRATGDHPAFTDEIGVFAQYDWIVSYGYRKIIREPILGRHRNRIVNLHTSYLPWNRGADPNYWSWAENTPKGVTLHFINEGIDTGDIIAQRPVAMMPGETLGTSYHRLRLAAELLFLDTWPLIRNGYIAPYPQPAGTSHKKADRPDVPWRTSVADLPPALCFGMACNPEDDVRATK